MALIEVWRTTPLLTAEFGRLEMMMEVNLDDAFEIGDKVEKLSGYKYPGVVVAKFRTTAGKIRYVVECTAPDCQGMLHIFNAAQLSMSVND